MVNYMVITRTPDLLDTIITIFYVNTKNDLDTSIAVYESDIEIIENFSDFKMWYTSPKTGNIVSGVRQLRESRARHGLSDFIQRPEKDKFGKPK